ncbi:MAG: oligosaccharide flippase family protein [Armatimonadetes bacterium]|nr:oligosaccharide flippase family protein [Armatimonadota bacterium]
MSQLKRTAVTGYLWQILGQVGQRGVALLAIMILARFVSKEDLGVYGVAISVITFIEMLRLGGVLQAFIAHPGDEEDAKDTVFWIALLLGVGYTAILFLGAPAVASLFKSPDLLPILRVLSLTQLIDSFRLVPHALLLRRYRFREKSICDSVPVFIGAAAAVVSLAFLPEDKRVWCLVLMFLCRSLSAVVITHLFLPHWPRATFDKAIGRTLAWNGFKILMSNFPSGTLEQFLRPVVGLRAGMAAAGVFNLAYSTTTPAGMVSHAANWTLFPILARHAEQAEKLRDYLLRALKMVPLPAVALLTWLILTAPDLIPLAFSERWAPAAAPAQWLSLAIILRSYTYVSINSMLAAGRASPAIFIWWATLLLAVALFLKWPLAEGDATTPARIVAVFYGFSCLLSLILDSVTFGLRPVAIARALLPTAVSCGAAAAAASAVWASGLLDAWPLLRLLVVTVVYTLTFLPICGKMMGGTWRSLFHPRGFKELLRVN